MENFKTITVCSDPIYPDLDKFDEERVMKVLKRYGIADLDFWLEEGFGLTVDADILQPDLILGGFQTFILSGTDKRLVLTYREEMDGLDVVEASDDLSKQTILATIPLQDYLSICCL